MTKYPKIVFAKAIDELLIEIRFDDGTTKFYNFYEFVKKHNFRELENFGFFKSFSIASGGYGIVWNDEIDIAESELWLNGSDDIPEIVE